MYFVTGNKNKFQEASRVFPDLEQLDIELTEIQSLNPRAVVAAKLKEAHLHHPEELVVEDISLEIKGLGNLPGTFVKWFLKSLTLEQIADLSQRSGSPEAVARAVLTYGRPGQEPVFIEELRSGRIVEPRGDRGFGWDPIFLMAGQEQTQAERKAKGIICIREAAFLKLRAHLG